MRYLYLSVYSISFALLWGFCFRSYPEANSLTCGIGLTLTFVASFFIQKEYDFKMSIAEKLVLLIFPALITVPDFTKGGNILYSPFSVGLIFLTLNLFVFKDLRIFRNNIFFVLVTISYSMIIYNRWHYFTFGNTEEKSIIIDESNNSNSDKLQEIPDKSIDISSYSFLNLKSDTVSIQSDKPYIFIETWNEACGPCKKAIREIVPILDTMRNYMDSYFIYENEKFDKNVFVSSAKKEKGLANQNVLADYDQEFFNSMKMISFPVFMIIDNRENKIKFMLAGYNKQKLIEKLKQR